MHIYYLTGFRRRLLVVLQWAWSYLSFRRGARLIVEKEWRFHPAAAAKDNAANNPARRPPGNPANEPAQS